jgi:plastocyanin
MRRVLLGSLIAASLFPITSLSAGLGPHPISVQDSAFVPDVEPDVHEGEIVHWEWEGTSEGHNVREDGRIFRSGPPTSIDGTIYERTFSAGTFHYFCELHGSRFGGMAGLVRVEMGQGITPGGYPTLIWASEDSNTGRAFDVQFRIQDGPWRPWLRDTTRVQAAFGINDRPVHWNPAKEYRFRTRSQKRVDTPKRVSRWSPVELWD